MFRVSGGSHCNTFRFGIGKASVKPLKIEVMTRTGIQLTAVWGNDDAQSSVLVSRRRWTAIQSGAVHTVDASSSYEGKRYKVVWRFANGQVSIDGVDGMECVVCLPVGELVSTDPSATASSKACRKS
jgi:hypothetical protein